MLYVAYGDSGEELYDKFVESSAGRRVISMLEGAVYLIHKYPLQNEEMRKEFEKIFIKSFQDMINDRMVKDDN